jgi:DNA-binding transcriptional MerR regulator
MLSDSLSLMDLAKETGIEPRTIRSYIERGLLPAAQSRGRGATYSQEHLARLQLIQAVRRARPTITLGELRIHLQQLTPAQIRSIADGSVTGAADPAESPAVGQAETYDTEVDEEFPRMTEWGDTAVNLTGAERLVRLLRDVSQFAPQVPASRVERWHRIAVTPDIELNVRAEFSREQLLAFQELSDLLRHLLQNPGAIVMQGGE